MQKSTFGTFDTGQNVSTEVSLYTVPAGKVFVLDAVSVASLLSPNDHLLDAQIRLMLDNSPFTVYVQPAPEGVFTPTGANVFRKTQVVTAYAGPGTNVTAFATRDGTSLSSTAVLFGIAGRLIDVQ